jgi:nitric oxide reductase activation protein
VCRRFRNEIAQTVVHLFMAWWVAQHDASVTHVLVDVSVRKMAKLANPQRILADFDSTF